MSVGVRRLGATLLIVGRALELKWGGKHVMAAVRVHGTFLDLCVWNSSKRTPEVSDLVGERY